MVTIRTAVDASAMIVMLIEENDRGHLVSDRLSGSSCCAPELLPFEVANVLRRKTIAGILPERQAKRALNVLEEFPIELWPWKPLSSRIWRLRGSITAYDASYIAVAELLGCPLLTGDARLSRAPGARCAVEVI